MFCLVGVWIIKFSAKLKNGWQMPLNNCCYLSREAGTQTLLCNADDDPDNVWYEGKKRVNNNFHCFKSEEARFLLTSCCQVYVLQGPKKLQCYNVAIFISDTLMASFILNILSVVLVFGSRFV